MKYRIVDADNRAECSKPKTFEEVKAWFEPSAEFEEDHDKWAEIQDIDDMRIKGIGTISKEKAMEILTREGRKAVRDGEITTEELGEMYKLQKVKEACKIGTCADSFNNSYEWIPDELKEELTPEQLGALTEAFYNCYGAGKNDKRGD